MSLFQLFQKAEEMILEASSCITGTQRHQGHLEKFSLWSRVFFLAAPSAGIVTNQTAWKDPHLLSKLELTQHRIIIITVVTTKVVP